MIIIRPGNGAPPAPERAGTMKVLIQDIVVGDRFRKDKGDIDGLMKSIKELGLLQPIGITKDNVLVFGERRLTACYALGWSEIEARVVDVSSIIEGEFAENEVRKAFTPSERLAIADAVQREIGRRQGTRTDIVSLADKRKEQLRDHGPEVKKGERTRDVVAKISGFSSSKQMERTAKVVEDGSPQLVAAMDKGEVSARKAADLANLTAPEQVVSLQGEKAEREAREEAEKVLLQEVAHYKLQNPGNAYTDYIEKNRKRPDKETAADIGRLLGGQVKADDGSMQPPKSKAQKVSEKKQKDARKEESNLRRQAYHAYISVCYLGQNHDDPEKLLHLINEYELPRMIEYFENAVEWFTRFAKEWRKHAEKNNIK